MSQCKRCDRPLNNPNSIEKEYGPTCKRKHEEAEAEFLRIQITMEEELAYQEKVKR